MVLEEVVNSSELIDAVTPVILDKLAPLMGVFKAIGIAVLVYLIILIFRGVMSIRNSMRLKRIEEKLDLLLENYRFKNKKVRK